MVGVKFICALREVGRFGSGALRFRCLLLGYRRFSFGSGCPLVGLRLLTIRLELSICTK